MAHTDHHTRAARLGHSDRRDSGARHSLGVSLANRGAGAHFRREENSAVGGKTRLRRYVRRTGRAAFRSEVAEYVR